MKNCLSNVINMVLFVFSNPNLVQTPFLIKISKIFFSYFIRNVIQLIFVNTMGRCCV
nr:MAG TPA: hypothetical protein [Caudoviricetes sp.]